MTARGRGRPPLPDDLARRVFELVEAQVAAGNYTGPTPACDALADIVGRPGGTLAKAGPLSLWQILACAGSVDFRSVKTWEELYRAGRKQAGLPPLPAGRKKRT